MAAGPGRDWFHCNRCYRQEGARFSVTSCGHVLCEACLGAGRGPQAFTPRRTTAGPCPICAATCRRFPIPEQLEETLFLKSPATIARQRLAHISQVSRLGGLSAICRHPQNPMNTKFLLLRPGASSRHRWTCCSPPTVTQRAGLRQHCGTPARRWTPSRGLPYLAVEQVSPKHNSGNGGGSQRSAPHVSPCRSSTPRPIGITSPATTVTPQPRRQLSGQVVSRLATLEYPSANSTPTWLAPSPGSTRGLPHRAALLASHTPLWGPFTTPPLPVAVLPGEPQRFLSAGLQPPRV
ncbi:RING finger protein 212B isoform X13 [Numida meleagris]|uniref:RING finger protein 212B isoform X13 n=1 Tax=Numida meleagris TaxID=8996 RepID=UPI000B3E10D0|nr:RING finger protein 212B isoform X13 [Numida meleagris]